MYTFGHQVLAQSSNNSMSVSSSSSSSYVAVRGFIARTILVFLLVIIEVGDAATSLSPDFYAYTCPKLDSIVRHKVRKAVQQEPRMGASLLRLHFHDCFVNGCDASVLLDDTPTFTGEKTALPNLNSLRGFEVIDDIKTKLEKGCPGVVSCADITALAALNGVVELGGPSWIVPLGRRDATTANFTAANLDLPPPFANLSGLISAFSRKGFTAREMITLSGAHTIGLARCITFRDRIYNDTDIDPKYAATLRATCPQVSGNGDNNLSPFDVASPMVFDNDYYQNLIKQLGLLHSDQQLLSSSPTRSQVQSYINDPTTFFTDFAKAMVKMSRLSPITGTQGQIRINCRRVNPSGVVDVKEVVVEQGDKAMSY